MTTPTPTPPGEEQPNTVQLDLSQLLPLLERQEQIYQQLQALSQQQDQLITDGASDALLGLLTQRQHHVDELMRLNHELEPYRLQWDQALGGLAKPDQNRVTQLVKKVEQLLGAIIKQDNADRQRLEQERSAVSTQMNQISHASTAMRAYKVQTSTSGNQYTDRQG